MSVETGGGEVRRVSVRDCSYRGLRLAGTPFTPPPPAHRSLSRTGRRPVGCVPARDPVPEAPAALGGHRMSQCAVPAPLPRMQPAAHSDRASPHPQRTIHTRDSASIAANHQRGGISQSVRWVVFMAGRSGFGRSTRRVDTVPTIAHHFAPSRSVVNRASLPVALSLPGGPTLAACKHHHPPAHLTSPHPSEFAICHLPICHFSPLPPPAPTQSARATHTPPHHVAILIACPCIRQNEWRRLHWPTLRP